MEREQGACDEGVGVRGICLWVKRFWDFGGSGGPFTGDGDAGPVGDGGFAGVGSEDETAVGQVADAHVDA